MLFEDEVADNEEEVVDVAVCAVVEVAVPGVVSIASASDHT